MRYEGGSRGSFNTSSLALGGNSVCSTKEIPLELGSDDGFDLVVIDAGVASVYFSMEFLYPIVFVVVSCTYAHAIQTPRYASK